jgi:hypothetical protein
MDEIRRLEENLKKLEDAVARLGFVLRELSTLTRVKVEQSDETEGAELLGGRGRDGLR